MTCHVHSFSPPCVSGHLSRRDLKQLRQINAFSRGSQGPVQDGRALGRACWRLPQLSAAAPEFESSSKMPVPRSWSKDQPGLPEIAVADPQPLAACRKGWEPARRRAKTGASKGSVSERAPTGHPEPCTFPSEAPASFLPSRPTKGCWLLPGPKLPAPGPRAQCAAFDGLLLRATAPSWAVQSQLVSLSPRICMSFCFSSVPRSRFTRQVCAHSPIAFFLEGGRWQMN